MKRTFNLKAVAILIVTVGVLAGSVHLLHGVQVRRNSRAILDQANRARDDKDTAREYRYLQAYLALQPRDNEVRIRFANFLHQNARNVRERQRAFFRLDEAVRLSPDDDVLRRKVIDTAVAIGRPQDALDHLTILHKKQGGKNALLEEEMGQAEEALFHWDKALGWYTQAIQHDPTRVTSYGAKARLLRQRFAKPQEADEVIEAMVKANPKSPEALMTQVHYDRAYKGTQEALAHARAMEKTIEAHAAEKPEMLLLTATVEADAGNLDKARALLVRGQKLHPKNLSFTRELARLDLRTGKRNEALATLRGIIDKLPRGDFDFLVTVDLLIDVGEKAEARKIVNRTTRDAGTAALLDYLEGRLAQAEGQWSLAMGLFDRARQNRNLPPEMVAQVHLQLARCYAQLGNPDRMLDSAQAALQNDPMWAPGLLARADALILLGRFEEALAAVEQLAPRVPAARLSAVRLLISRNLRLPARQRDWSAALKQLDALPEGMRGEAEATLLRAQILGAQKDLPGAIEVLQKGLEKNAQQVNLWLNLADALALSGKKTEAPAVLDRAEKALGDRIEWRLARAQLAIRQEDPAAARRLLDKAERDAQGLDKEERIRWLRALGSFHVGQGDTKAARRLFRLVTELRPSDLEAWSALFDLTVREGESDNLAPLIAAMREIEGAEGVRWRYGEAYLLSLSNNRDDHERARTWLREARKRRPSWGPPYILEGRLAEVQGNLDEAAKMYQAALDRGTPSVELVTRLVAVLTRQGNSTEAEAVFARFRDLVPRSGDLSRLAVLTSLRGEDRKAALDLADQMLPADSRSYQNHLLRAQVLWANEKLDEAEKALRQAVTVGAKQPECHVALVAFLASRDRERAKKEIEAARKALPADVAPLALGTCYEVVGEREKAEAEYQAALKAKPDHPPVLRALAQFYLRTGRLASAEPYFKKLIALPGISGEQHAAWARRTWALGLAATGDYQRSRQALALLEENFKGRTPSGEDQRTRALILARQPGDRREAIKELEASFARIHPTSEEEFFLATLLIANQEWERGQARLQRLLGSRGGNNPVFLVYFLQQLLEHNELDQVDPWLAQLEKLEPGSLRTVSIKARILHARKQGKEALALLRKYAETQSKDPLQQLGVARVLESIGFVVEAEPYYRALARALGDKQPAAMLPLVGYLGRRNRVAEALDLCEKLHGKVPDTGLVEVWVNILRDGQPTAEQCRRVEGWLQAAKKKKPDQLLFDLALANISDLQDRTAEAARIYQAVLEKDDRNLLAYNNLAVLLALREKKGEEALTRINKALELAGPLPEMLDTRAMVYLSMEQYRRAVDDLERAIQMMPDPASLFRLAQAYLGVEDLRNARRVWLKARAGGFKLSNLHPLERDGARKALQVLEKN